MRVFLTGATGLVGSALREALVARGDEVVALTRSPQEEKRGVEWVVADPFAVSTWATSVDGCDAVVNLAGESIAQRWNDAARKRIMASRVGVTTAIAHALEAAKNPPSLMLSASAVGYYGLSRENTFDETSPRGEGFLASVAAEWESAARACPTRVSILRFGVILASTGGALPKLALPFRMFTGGPLGDGKQWMSWVHIRDVVALISQQLESRSPPPTLNVVAPNPATMDEMARTLGRVLRRPSAIGAPRVFIELALGQMARETILEGQRVTSIANELGFDFLYPELESALRDLLR